MNGLVGYGSSSEDEDDVKPATINTTDSTVSPTRDTTSLLTNGTTDEKTEHPARENAAALSETMQRPIVGPARPTEDTSISLYDDDNSQELPPMPESDMLRYLTQPTHPMASLPPEPAETADPAVTAKFKRFLELKAKGVHFNEDLADKTSFKNPNFFPSLLKRTGLAPRAQYSSVLSSDIFDFDVFPEWAYKERLSTSQQTISAELDARKKAQSAAGKRTIAFTSAAQSDAKSGDATFGNITKRQKT